MIAQFFGKLAALRSRGATGLDRPPLLVTTAVSLAAQTSWSIRVPCPGGSAASTVGCGRRVPSAAAALASGVLSGGLGALGFGGAVGTRAATPANVLGNILFVASDLGWVEANDL